MVLIVRLINWFQRKEKIKFKAAFHEMFLHSFDAMALIDVNLKVVKSNIEFENVFMPVTSGNYPVGSIPLWKIFAEFEGADQHECETRLYKYVVNELKTPAFSEVSLRAFDTLIRIGDLRLLSVDGGYLFIFRNTLVFRERESKLLMNAQEDKLTGLLNRQGITDRLDGAIEMFEPLSKFKVGVLFLDLDEFKSINDTFGHDAGDLVLQYVAKAIQKVLPDYSSISRIGGDEFVCIIPVCESRVVLYNYGLKVIEAVAKDINVNETEVVNIKCSVGGALYPDHSKIYESGDMNPTSAILKASDTAMYEAKNSGKNRVYVAE